MSMADIDREFYGDKRAWLQKARDLGLNGDSLLEGAASSQMIAADRVSAEQEAVSFDIVEIPQEFDVLRLSLFLKGTDQEDGLIISLNDEGPTWMELFISDIRHEYIVLDIPAYWDETIPKNFWMMNGTRVIESTLIDPITSISVEADMGSFVEGSRYNLVGLYRRTLGGDL